MTQVDFEQARGREFSPAARSLFGNVRLAFPQGEDLDSQLDSARLGDCRLSRLTTGAHLVFGDDVARHSYDPDAIKLIIQLRGLSEIAQGGRKVIVGSEAAVIYDPTRPYFLANPEPVHLLLLQVPRQSLPVQLTNGLTQPFCAGEEQSGLQSVLQSLMTSTLDEIDRLDGVARSSIGRTMAGLVRTMLEAHPMVDDGDSTSLGVLRMRVKAHLDANLGRPDLTIADVARKMGCTPRYIFKAFAAEATTPSEYLWERRLEIARDRLLAAQYAGQSISEIAFGLGFSSSAHFSRAFRGRYEISPRDLRRTAVN